MKWFKQFLFVIACVVPWLIAGVLFTWVMAKHFPASGMFVMDIPVDGRSPWFEAFLPGQRASSPGLQAEGWTGQRITDEPVYARLRVPGAYNQADVQVEFRPNTQPLIELGVERGTETSASYELSALWSLELSQSDFQPIATASGPWWIKPGTTISQLSDAAESRVFWHASGTIAEAWMDQGPVTPQTVSSSLRGTHDYWFVPVDGRINLTLTLQDMNRSAHHSTATFRLTRGQELIWSDALNFGGDADVRPSVVVTKELSFQDLAPGVYRLSVLMDDSLFIRAWKTDVKRWVIGPRVYFADEVGYSTSTRSVRVYTNSHHFEVKTLHKEGLQKVQFGQRASTTLVETHTTYQLSRDASERQAPLPLTLPKGNVWTLGDGYVSWSQNALFYPSPRRLTDETSLAEEAIQAVATSYRAPVPLGDGWYRATINVDLDPRQDRLKLVIAAPGIARRNAAIDIRRFVVTYRRPPLVEAWWLPFKQELIRAWQRW